jgi:uncharacterized protein (DUF736 family)
MDKQPSVKIGAGWLRETQGGLKYISIKFNNDTSAAMFKQDEKKTENSPDYRLVMDLESAERLDLVSDYDKATMGEKGLKTYPKKQTDAVDDVDVDDIPF